MRRVLVALAVVMLILSGCGPAIMPAAAPQAQNGENFVVALPRLTVTFDDNGTPGFEGLDVQKVAASMGYPLDLTAFRMDPQYVNWMKQAGIQHVELRQTGNGMAVLVNGKLMPHLTYEDGSLTAAGSMVKMLGPQYEQLGSLVEKLGPIAQRMGLSVAVKFPTAAGQEAIPFASDAVAAATAVPAAGPASAVAQFEITYDEQGVPSIMGISARDLANAGINAPLALAPYAIQQAEANNIQALQLRSKGDGLHLYVNGLPLPAISWDQVMLQNTLDTAQQMYGHLGIDWNMISSLVPLLSNTDVSIMIHLPVAAGQTAIPVKMQ